MHGEVLVELLQCQRSSGLVRTDCSSIQRTERNPGMCTLSVMTAGQSTGLSLCASMIAQASGLPSSARSKCS